MTTFLLITAASAISWWVGFIVCAVGVSIALRGHPNGSKFRRWALTTMWERDVHGVLFGWFFRSCRVFPGDSGYRSYLRYLMRTERLTIRNRAD